jgi:hypothetical protein
MLVGTLPVQLVWWHHVDVENSHDQEEFERAAALSAFRDRQKPPPSWAPRRTSESDPVGVLALAVFCFTMLAILGALLVGTEHVVLGFVVYLGMLVSGLVALVSGVAAGVEWGMRRSRQ